MIIRPYNGWSEGKAFPPKNSYCELLRLNTKGEFMLKALENLKKIDAEIQVVSHALAILGWDQETYMPAKAIGERAEQMSFLEGLIHEKITSREIGDTLEALEADGINDKKNEADGRFTPMDRSFFREFKRIFSKRIKLPKTLVTDIAKEVSLAQAKWAIARKESRFSLFAPSLERLLKLMNQKAECIGFGKNKYDALLDDYEPWMKTEELDVIFSKFSDRLARLVAGIADKKSKPEKQFFARAYNQKKQEAISRELMQIMGFDFDRGRIDVSAHPFTATLGASDIRITTRYRKNNLISAIYSTIHETGHALYEQGFGNDISGTLLGTGASMGIHESQSRLWENIIGRSRGFSMRILGRIKKIFPQQTSGLDNEIFYKKIVNFVEPSLVRVEADEVTYNLHIILRYNLERRLMDGDLSVADLPAAWNEESIKLLGIGPKKDSEGVLQDIHWSMGAIGYFPTYALGNLYGAQFYSKMLDHIPDADIITGSFNDSTISSVLEWLRTNIHRHGNVLTAGELCRTVTGEPLDSDYFMTYLERKFGEIYGL
jgi:carboxypeptidase Taq